MTDDLMQWAGPSKAPDMQSLADRYAVSQLVKIYALGVDMRKYELSRSAFAPDGAASEVETMADINAIIGSNPRRG